MYPGVVCAHNFVEGSGLISYDISGNGNDITIEGGASWEDGEGLQVDLNGEHGLLSNAGNSIVNSNAGTIIMRVKSLSAITDGTFRFLLGGNSSGIYINKSSNNHLYFTINPVDFERYVAIAPGDIPNWEIGTQIAVRWDRVSSIWNSDNMVINIDGVNIIPTFDDEESTPWDEFDMDNNYAILNNLTSLNFIFNGIIQEISFFGIVLSDSQIIDIYNDFSILYQDETSLIKTYCRQIYY